MISEDFVEQPEEKTEVKSAKYSNLSIVEEVRVNCILLSSKLLLGQKIGRG